jgi:hypothetical protein
VARAASIARFYACELGKRAAQRAMSAGEQYGHILANAKVLAQLATTSQKAFSAVSAKMDVLVARRPRAAH